MDRSLAKGFAHRFLDRHQPHGDVVGWHDGPRRMAAINYFAGASLAKKPGRVLERLRPILAPVWTRAVIPEWNRKGVCAATATAISSARKLGAPP